jgi:hypothetical protein
VKKSPTYRFERSSASQFTTFKRCQRLWWFQNPAGQRSEPTPPQVLGERLHHQNERYLLGGPLPEHASASRLMEDVKVPRPAAGLLVEQPKNYNLGLTLSGIAIRGRPDLIVPPTVSATSFDIWDWKSTSSFNWTKTEEELANDVQAIIYSKYGFTKLYPNAVTASFWHGYMLTDGVGHQVVGPVSISRSEADEKFAAMSPIVDEMAEIALIENHEDVPRPDTDAPCNAFGGCPFKETCGVGIQTFESLFSDRTPTPITSTITSAIMSLRDKLNALKNTQTTATPPPAPVVETSTAPLGLNPPDAASTDKADPPPGYVVKSSAPISAALDDVERAVASLRAALGL